MNKTEVLVVRDANESKRRGKQSNGKIGTARSDPGLKYWHGRSRAAVVAKRDADSVLEKEFRQTVD